MAETPSSAAVPPKPLSTPLPRSPGAHEAVDRLIAMATEKRADRPPASDAASVAEPAAPVSKARAMVLPPERERAPQSFSAGHTAARVFSMLRPVLPALAGALRLVDHGAVQAAARLLPLLAGMPTQSSAPAPAAEPSTASALAAVEAGQHELREEIEGAALTIARLEGQLTEIRWKYAQLDSQQTVTAEKLREVGGRVKVLTYTIAVLAPVMIALTILVLFHLRS